MRKAPLLLGLLLLFSVGATVVWKLRSRATPSIANTPSYLEQGEAKWKEGRIREAVIQFNRAIAVNPKDEHAYLRLAQLYKGQDRADLALDVLEMLSASNPNAPHLQIQMAEEGLDVEDQELAQTCAEKALRQEPQNARAHLIYGLTLINRRRFDEALKTLLKAQDLAPADVEIGQALIELYQVKGEFRKSIQVGQKMIQSAPRSARLHFRLGYAYAHLEGVSSLKNAEQHLKLAIEVMPDWYEPYAELGRIALLQNKAESAQGYLEKAWERDPTVLEVGGKLALLWKRQGDPRYENLTKKLGQLRLEKQRYETIRKTEEKQALSPTKTVALAQAEAAEGRYAVALYRIKKILAHDSTYLPALRLYRTLDQRARTGYPEYLLPGPHITLEPGS